VEEGSRFATIEERETEVFSKCTDVEDLGRAKVCENDVSIIGPEYVSRFHVAVNDVTFMKGFETQNLYNGRIKCGDGGGEKSIYDSDV
jgi:hypothetical protein